MLRRIKVFVGTVSLIALLLFPGHAQNRVNPDEASREEDKKAQELAEAVKKEFQSYFGDPLPGMWIGENMSLSIKKEGSLYLVELSRNLKRVGEYAAPLKDDQLALGSPGSISVLKSSGQLLFGGTRFVRVRR